MSTRYGIPRQPCPVCDRPVAILRDGRIGRHGHKGDPPVWPPQTCPGWGQMPKEPDGPR